MEWYKDGLYPEWHVSGKDFSPKELQAKFPNLLLGPTNEKDDIVIRGPGRGKEYGYGSTVIVVDDKIVYKFNWLLDFILENGDLIRKMGVDDEIIWIVWWGIQGNMELDKNLISKLAKTGLNMAMDYYYIDDKPTAFEETKNCA